MPGASCSPVVVVVLPLPPRLGPGYLNVQRAGVTHAVLKLVGLQHRVIGRGSASQSTTSHAGGTQLPFCGLSGCSGGGGASGVSAGRGSSQGNRRCKKGRHAVAFPACSAQHSAAPRPRRAAPPPTRCNAATPRTQVPITPLPALQPAAHLEALYARPHQRPQRVAHGHNRQVVILRWGERAGRGQRGKAAAKPTAGMTATLVPAREGMLGALLAFFSLAATLPDQTTTC